MSLLLVAVLVLAALIVGAYSHKWLAKVTGAPANLNASNALTAADSAIAAAKKAAQDVAKKV